MSLEPDLRCYYHPDVPATSQCDRCGDYLCDECMDVYHGEPLCPKCAAAARAKTERPTVDDAPSITLWIIAPVSAAAPAAFVASMFLGSWMIQVLAVAAACVGSVVSVLVYGAMHPRSRIPLSLAATNLAGIGCALLRGGGPVTVGLLLLALSPSVGLLLALDAMLREDGTLRDLLLAILAPVLWFVVPILLFIRGLMRPWL